MIPIDRKEIEPVPNKDSNGEQQSKIKKEENIPTHNNQQISPEEIPKVKSLAKKKIKVKTNTTQNDEYVLYKSNLNQIDTYLF